MKKIRIQHRKTDYAVEFRSDDQSFIDSEIARVTAKTQLWMPEREIVALSESYDEADVLSTRSEEVSPAVLDENLVEVTPAVIVNYVTLKAEYVITEEDITSQYEAAQLRASRLAEGKKARECCQAILDFVGGLNVERNLSVAQIQQMQVDFATVYSSLQANMPRTVKQLALATNPTELVTQELLDETLAILAKFGY